MYKIECSRCTGGAGIISAFRHVQGGVCFKCGGKGYTTSRTSPEARAKAKAKRDEQQQTRILAGQAEFNALASRYANDSRIGAARRAWIAKGNLCRDIYQALADIDAGTYTGDTARFLRNIAANL